MVHASSGRGTWRKVADLRISAEKVDVICAGNAVCGRGYIVHGLPGHLLDPHRLVVFWVESCLAEGEMLAEKGLPVSGQEKGAALVHEVSEVTFCDCRD